MDGEVESELEEPYYEPAKFFDNTILPRPELEDALIFGPQGSNQYYGPVSTERYFELEVTRLPKENKVRLSDNEQDCIVVIWEKQLQVPKEIVKLFFLNIWSDLYRSIHIMKYPFYVCLYDFNVPLLSTHFTNLLVFTGNKNDLPISYFSGPNNLHVYHSLRYVLCVCNITTSSNSPNPDICNGSCFRTVGSLEFHLVWYQPCLLYTSRCV